MGRALAAVYRKAGAAPGRVIGALNGVRKLDLDRMERNYRPADRTGIELADLYCIDQRGV